MAVKLMAALRDVRDGKKLETGYLSPQHMLLHLGFIKEEVVNKPCRSCGHPQVDYRYNKMTLAGRSALEMLDAQGTEARRAETVKQGSVHDGPVP